MPCDRRSFLGAIAVAVATLPPHLARAQDRPLRIVVPFSAGGSTDVAARVLAAAIGKSSGRVVIVDNRPGAGGVIGSLDVVRARPDGNTVLYMTGSHTTNAVVIKNLPYDSIADFTPITTLARSSGFALFVGEKSPYKLLDQFVAAARARPGRLSFGSLGVGSTTHVMGALFCREAGIDLLHIPFNATPTRELMGGTVDSAFLSPAGVRPQIRAGKLRAMGVSGTKRSRLLPNVPTFAESGLKLQDIPAWSGFFGPAKMPPDLVQSLYQTIVKAAQTPLVEDFLHDHGSELEAMPPERFTAYVTSEIQRYRTLLPALGIQLN